MATATFRFYEELNDFLPRHRRKRSFEYCFEHRASVKDMIEAMGVPHTEVDLILVNGASVDFSHIVRDRDRISVYPVFESMDIAELVRVRPEPLRRIAFVVDANLGKLSRLLRLLGFDAWYDTGLEDAEVARVAASNRRILLTRDRGLLKRRCVTHGYFVRATDPRAQTREVIARFDLRRLARPFSRCTRCNAAVEPVPPQEAAPNLPRRTRLCYDEFWSCRGCGRLYWKGSHHRHMRAFIDEVLQEPDQQPPADSV